MTTKKPRKPPLPALVSGDLVRIADSVLGPLAGRVGTVLNREPESIYCVQLARTEDRPSCVVRIKRADLVLEVAAPGEVSYG